LSNVAGEEIPEVNRGFYLGTSSINGGCAIWLYNFIHVHSNPENLEIWSRYHWANILVAHFLASLLGVARHIKWYRFFVNYISFLLGGYHMCM
jgi:hypothetical protein